MKKVEQAEQDRSRQRRPARKLTAVIAAVIALVVLSLTAFAAYENNWFGFGQIFGQKAALVEQDVVYYTPTQPEAAAGVPTQPESPAETPAAVEATAPAEPVAEAETEEYRFALQSMVVGHDTLLAIVRVDAKSEAAAAALEVCTTEAWPGEQGGFYLIAECIAWGHESESTNGSMAMHLLTVEGNTGYFLLTNTGGSFALDDRIKIHMLDGARGKDLVEVPVERIMETERTLSLDASAYEGKAYRYERLTVTPMGLKLWGSYDLPTDRSETPSVRLELKDGTSFGLWGPDNGYQNAPFGTYGSLTSSFAGGRPEEPTLEYSWTFSQLVDLDELSVIYVDSVAYRLP